MTASLIDTLTSLVTPATRSAVASQLDETEPAVNMALRAAFGAILGAMLARSDESELMTEIAGLVNTGEVSLPPPDELSALPPVLSDPSRTSSVSSSLLKQLFDDRIGDVSEVVATASDVSAASARSVLALAAPFVLGVMRKASAPDGFDSVSLVSFLESQRDSIEIATPEGLLATPGVLDVLPESTVVDATRATSAPVTVRQARARSRWTGPLLGIAVIAALLAIVWPRSTTNVPTPDLAEAPSSVAADSQRSADSAADTLVGTPAPMSARVVRVLPGGRELSIAEGSIEARLADFLADSTRSVRDTLWFTFDRISFEATSTVLAASSSAQLDNIADILRAYSSASVEIAGHTDNRGDPALDRELSDGRAEAVKAALVQRGISARRITAEGYGDRYPISDNATDEGRRLNRRIALRVTER